MPGIGGTGVVTVSQILQMAAHLDNRYSAGLEQIGLAQKGGPVVSDLRISRSPISGAVRASRATADVLIGFDLLGVATENHLATAHPSRCVAVVNTALVPSAAMVTNQLAVPGSPDDAVTRIEAATSGPNVYLDALALSEALFGDHMPANMVLVGAAFQHGCLTVSAGAVEQAIRLNGAAVETNLMAFRWGRAAVVDRKATLAAVVPPAVAVVAVDEASAALAAHTAPDDGELRQMLATRIADLTSFQNAGYARTYAEDVRYVSTEATARAGAAAPIAVAYAENLHKLMAYKDEYEVARLHLDRAEESRRDREFGPDARVSVLLHPPILRALGVKRKIRLRRTATPVFRALHAARGLRGTPFDVFGYAAVRRVERQLIVEYRDLMRTALAHLTPENSESVAALAALPGLIRGYEGIKLAGAVRYRAEARAALEGLVSGRSPVEPGNRATTQPHTIQGATS
ncbi:2-oxoacid:acceptor oxidoreductase family protein [Streptomyces canus]|uniref:DUF6537 domain-containing protein n=1 Tax=Streptomyces canus TaxID=58343 RepID=UPI00224CAA53|nr:DUF6537 domain-containing protein [Streptomyces canus]MCX5257863.1 2-oxoacid:acceptor oxidoreductase family protein [Streptomyces canus]